MRAERDPAETDKPNHENHHRKDKRASTAALAYRNQEQSELPVEQCGANRVTASKTITRPINEPAIDKRAMPMDEHFKPLVEQHPPWDHHNHRHQRGPPAFENEK